MPAKTIKKDDPKEKIESESTPPKAKEEEKVTEKESSVLIPKKEDKEKIEKPQESEEKVEEIKDKKDEEAKTEEDIKPKDEKKVPKVSSFSMLDTKGADSKETKVVVEEEKPEETEEVAEEADLPEDKEAAEEKKKKDEISSDEVKKWLKDIKPDTTKEVEKKGGRSFKTIFIIVIILAVVAAIAGGVIYYRSGTAQLTEKAPSETTIDEDQPTEEPTSTPEEIDYSAYSVSILNGTGIAGEATKVGDILEEAGFGEINTGNADSYDFESTTVSLKENIPETVFEKFRELLAEDYAVIKSEENLEEDSTYDIIIIVGVQKE